MLVLRFRVPRSANWTESGRIKLSTDAALEGVCGHASCCENCWLLSALQGRLRFASSLLDTRAAALADPTTSTIICGRPPAGSVALAVRRAAAPAAPSMSMSALTALIACAHTIWSRREDSGEEPYKCPLGCSICIAVTASGENVLTGCQICQLQRRRQEQLVQQCQPN